MRKERSKNKVYSAEFKIAVIEKMRKERLNYSETMREFFPEKPDRNFRFIKVWERIYLEEGAEGLMKERRGKAAKASNANMGRPPKFDKAVEEDLIAENQRLRMENEYLKKLQALVQERIDRESGKKQK